MLNDVGNKNKVYQKFTTSPIHWKIRTLWFDIETGVFFLSDIFIPWERTGAEARSVLQSFHPVTEHHILFSECHVANTGLPKVSWNDNKEKEKEKNPKKRSIFASRMCHAMVLWM